MTQAKARRALERFLADAEGAGRRCVLVITGKGAARDDGEGPIPDRDAGVLRRSLPRWLALPGLRERVVAYWPGDTASWRRRGVLHPAAPPPLSRSGSASGGTAPGSWSLGAAAPMMGNRSNAAGAKLA